MSVRVKSVMTDSPRAFQILNEFYFASPIFDAAPFYEEFTATVTINGSYSISLLDFDFTYSGTKTWNRAPITGNNLDNCLEIIPTNINGVTESLIGTIGVRSEPTEDVFLMYLRPSLDDTLGSFAPMYAPAYPAAVILAGSNIEDAAVIGTKTDNATSPATVTDITGDVSVGDLIFTFQGTPPGSRAIVNLMTVTGAANSAGFSDLFCVIEEDASAFSDAKWRDFRGTYSESRTNADGVVITLDVTIA